jgi:Leucine-rich repeat (LRR) protein
MGLNENAFTGSIPSSYTQMTNLRNLHLQKNELSGTIPENIGNLRELTSLDFEDNRLTGRIPDSMWELSHMEVFILDTQKQLEGSIPTTVGLWKNCTMFLVNVLNGLTGSTIPTEIGLLTNLIEFKTAQNHMRGTVSN